MKNLVFFTAILLTIFSCTTQKVDVDWDRSVDFTQFKTYQISSDSLDMNELDKKQFLTIFNNELNVKGLSVDVNPDLQIQVKPDFFFSESQNSSVGVGAGGGSFGSGGGFGGGVSFGIPINSTKLNQNYVIQFFDNNVLIWEGNLNVQVSENATMQTKGNAISKGVKKLMKNYPPKEK